MINETFYIFASLKQIETANKVQTIKTANIMKTTNETRRQVCEMMHKLMAQGITTKSEAMYLAWANVKLANAIKESIVEFTYFKIDGSVRVAHGTLRGDIIPPDAAHNQRHDKLQRADLLRHRQERLAVLQKGEPLLLTKKTMK